MVGIIRLFASLAPLYIGWNAIGALIKCKSQNKYRETCHRSAFLIVSIILLLVIPGEFLYSTFKYAGPSGYYTTNVDYTVSGEYEDKNGDWVEYYNSGRGPLEVYFDHDTEYEEYNDRTRVQEYSAYYAHSIKLGCFNSISFDLGDLEIASFHKFECEIEYKGHSYDLKVQVDDLDKDRPESSWEEKLKHVGALALAEHGALFLLSVLGIVGYVVSMKETEDEKKAYSVPAVHYHQPSLEIREPDANKNAAVPQQSREEASHFSSVQKAAQDIKNKYTDWYN